MPLGWIGGAWANGRVVRQSEGWRPVLRHGAWRLGGAMESLLERAQLHMKDWPPPHHREEPSWRLRLEFALCTAAGALGMIAMAYMLFSSVAALGHPGGLAADGCHNDRKNGGRHCHGNSGSRPEAPNAQRFAGGGAAYYANCSAARAAGAAPVRRGDPGYSSKLDRDGDGVGCE